MSCPTCCAGLPLLQNPTKLDHAIERQRTRARSGGGDLPTNVTLKRNPTMSRQKADASKPGYQRPSGGFGGQDGGGDGGAGGRSGGGDDYSRFCAGGDDDVEAPLPSGSGGGKKVDQ